MPVPANRPTQALIDEHEKILAMLDVLERLADLAEGGAPPVAAMSRALEFIREFADGVHHQKEEDLLFPAMERRGMPRGAGPVAVMLMEHDEGRAAAGGMQAGLDALAAGQAAGATTYARGARAYASILRDHIAKENQILFPMAEDVLEPEDKAELAVGFDDVDRAAEANIARLCEALDALTAELLGQPQR